MSGRAKGAPATPEEEREQLRQLTREAHEAAQDARDGERRARAALAELRKAYSDAAEEVALPVLEALQTEFRESRELLIAFQQTVADRTADAVQAIEENHARLAGFKTHGEFAQWLVNTVARTVYSELSTNAVFIRDVALVARNDPGRPVVPMESNPQILVATPQGLAEFVAAGGDPGTVIDAREATRPG